MTTKVKWVLAGLVALGLAVFDRGALAGDPPVAMLTQTQGQVEFSKDGTQWSAVTRNKFLFAGDMVRTGADGTGKLVNQANNTAQTMAANTVVKTAAAGVETVSGTLSAPEAVSGDLVAGLSNRFAEAQRYTTVRRAKKETGGDVALGLVQSVKASASFPDIVWENVGEKYSYAVSIDGKPAGKVAATSEQPVRYKLSGLTPGKHTVKVSVTEGDKPVAESKDTELTWLAEADDKAVTAGLSRVAAAAPKDDFALGSYLDEKGLTVAAMDHYRKFFSGNREDNDMRPLLIRVYNDLKLKELKTAEAELFNQIINAK